jgi:hypothetical protein
MRMVRVSAERVAQLEQMGRTGRVKMEACPTCDKLKFPGEDCQGCEEKAASILAAADGPALIACRKALADLLEWCAGGDIPDDLYQAGRSALELR